MSYYGRGDEMKTRAVVSRLTATLELLGLLVALAMPALAGDSWPQFRGPDGQGRADDEALPLHWSESEGENIVWKTALSGRGWSSPVVENGRIWVTTAEEQPASAEVQAQLQEKVAQSPVAGQMETAAAVKLSAIEVDLASGRVLQQVPLFDVANPPPIHGLNSYASPTAVIAEGRVVCHFGSMGTACLDAATGDVLWKRTLPIDHSVGPGSSPVVHRGLVMLTCDGIDKQYVAALELATGKIAWQVDRPPIRATNGEMRKAYCTPLVINAAGREQMIIPGAQWFISYDPVTGKELWRVDYGSGFSNTPRALFDGTTAYLNTGFVKPALCAVRVDGSGDVGATHVDWRHGQQMATMSSPVMADGKIYVISDGGVASCLDAETGDVAWRERIGGQFCASALLGAGRVYFCSQEGRTTVIAAGEKFEVLAKNDLDGKLMASPVAVAGDLLLRTDTHLYRIGEK
jgi:outer membrane protein assembly factor BamB